jgi:ATP-binding cassette subfamily B protein
VREHIAYVPQDNFLFSDTIYNNIAFSVDAADGESVENAAKTSDVHGDITGFAGGYETVLGERGVTVSGGQKQRISIARALIKDAPILLLDDAVSAVDVKTERSILNSLKELRRDRTTILIAHRISTVEGMDKIIYLEDGAVIDVGTHPQLVERCEGYRRSVELQKIEDEEVARDV